MVDLRAGCTIGQKYLIHTSGFRSPMHLNVHQHEDRTFAKFCPLQILYINSVTITYYYYTNLAIAPGSILWKKRVPDLYGPFTNWAIKPLLLCFWHMAKQTRKASQCTDNVFFRASKVFNASLWKNLSNPDRKDCNPPIEIMSPLTITTWRPLLSSPPV